MAAEHVQTHTPVSHSRPRSLTKGVAGCAWPIESSSRCNSLNSTLRTALARLHVSDRDIPALHRPARPIGGFERYRDFATVIVPWVERSPIVCTPPPSLAIGPASLPCGLSKTLSSQLSITFIHALRCEVADLVANASEERLETPTSPGLDES